MTTWLMDSEDPIEQRKPPTSYLEDAKHSLGRAKYRLLEKAKAVGDPEERLMGTVKPYTMSSRLKLRNLKRLAELVNQTQVPDRKSVV